MHKCELCNFTSKLKCDYERHKATKFHLHFASHMTKVLEQKEQEHQAEIDDYVKLHNSEIQWILQPTFSSIEEVQCHFFTNAMRLNRMKKEYHLQTFGQWITLNRLVCKELEQSFISNL